MVGKLKLEQELYRHIPCGGMHNYKVVEVRENPEGMQYIVQDKCCKHGWNCELLIAEDDKGDLVYIRMTNDDEENSQSHWHTHAGRFCTSLNQAKLDAYATSLRVANDKVESAERALKDAIDRRDQIKDMIDVVLSKETPDA